MTRRPPRRPSEVRAARRAKLRAMVAEQLKRDAEFFAKIRDELFPAPARNPADDAADDAADKGEP